MWFSKEFVGAPTARILAVLVLEVEKYQQWWISLWKAEVSHIRRYQLAM